MFKKSKVILKVIEKFPQLFYILRKTHVQYSTKQYALLIAINFSRQKINKRPM